MNFRQFLSTPEPATEPSAPAEAPELAAALESLSTQPPAEILQNETPALLTSKTSLPDDGSEAERAFELDVTQVGFVKRQLLSDALSAPTASERTAASKTLLAYSLRTKDKRDRSAEQGGRTIIMNVLQHVAQAQRHAALHES